VAVVVLDASSPLKNPDPRSHTKNVIALAQKDRLRHINSERLDGHSYPPYRLMFVYFCGD
jgi:hypothetical protein